MAERRCAEQARAGGERAPAPRRIRLENDVGVDAAETHRADTRAQRRARPRLSLRDPQWRAWSGKQLVWVRAPGCRRNYLVPERERCLDEARDPSGGLG